MMRRWLRRIRRWLRRELRNCICSYNAPAEHLLDIWDKDDRCIYCGEPKEDP